MLQNSIIAPVNGNIEIEKMIYIVVCS